MEPASAPGTFFVTDHYRGYPTVLVRLKKVSGEIGRASCRERV